ncbi:MAG: Ku protein [Gemmatimonadota bacterium]
MARSIWKGTLGFGLVTIGVELFSAEAPERLDLDLLDKRDMGRIGYLKINKTTGKPVPKEEIVRGFPVSANKYVVLSDADLKEANPVATRLLEVLGFVPVGAIPPLYFAKPYFVAPVKGSEKAYSLLRDTLAEAGQQAIAQVVIRTRQHITAVYPHERLLMAQILRYDDELQTPEDLGVAPPRKGVATAPRPAELSMAKKLVHEMAIDWTPRAYHDEYRNDLLKLIKRRTKGARTSKEPAEAPRETKVLDLMEALRKSVGAPHRKSGAKRARRSA